MDLYHESAVAIDTIDADNLTQARKNHHGSNHLLLASDTTAARSIKYNKFIDWDINANYISVNKESIHEGLIYTVLLMSFLM